MKKALNALFSKIKKHKIIFSFSIIFIYSQINNRTYNKFIPKYFRLRKCQKVLHERFNFSGKLKYDYLNKENFAKKPSFELNKVYPTNIFDTQKLLEIATDFNIPIINEFFYTNADFELKARDNTEMQNNQEKDFNDNSYANENNKIIRTVNEEIIYINFDHIKIDFSKFNKILKFDKDRNLITIEPGVKVKTLLEYLNQYHLTISELESNKLSELTISDIIYNNYYSFFEGKFLDEKIEEITVIVPNRQEALKLRQANDFLLSCVNLKDILCKNNIAIIRNLEIKFIFICILQSYISYMNEALVS